MKDEKAHIRVLSDQVINKIAAGEVVERPASVVKELVENSLDAGATDIAVEITAGGRTLISVADNGSGMDRNNALLSVERHATSKIGDIDDIERVGTLGFRGEALAAISSVSRFTLRTRPANELSGTELVMAGGKMQEVRDAGCAPGTLAEVRHLFFNVPARRKFLRLEQTELAHIRRIFMVYALANPSVGFKLKADGRQLYNLPANASLEDRLSDLFNFLSIRNIRKVAHIAGNLNISGYVALPSLTRPDRAEQYLFINKRPASAALLSGAIRDGYKMLIPRDRNPIVFIFLDLDPGLVDVNVHPAKKEVRFRNPLEVRNAVSEAIRFALANRPEEGARAVSSIPAPGKISADIKNRAHVPRDVPALAQIWDYSGYKRKTPASKIVEFGIGKAGAKKEKHLPAKEEAKSKPWAWRRVVGQIGSLYVLLETEDGLVLMDPHAAHERILFEKFMAEVAKGAAESQTLLMAESVVLAPTDSENLKRVIEPLKKFGFSIAEFGQDTFLVDAVPACFGNVAARALINEIASALSGTADRNKGEYMFEEQVAQAACRASVKAHTRLSSAEIENLVFQLENAEMPYTCPHGRPIIIHFSFQELARKFGRSAPGG